MCALQGCALDVCMEKMAKQSRTNDLIVVAAAWHVHFVFARVHAANTSLSI
jgi:hypothetical protein